MKLESQLNLGYCMGIYTSDAGPHLYFLCLALSSQLSLSEEVQALSIIDK